MSTKTNSDILLQHSFSRNVSNSKLSVHLIQPRNNKLLKLQLILSLILLIMNFISCMFYLFTINDISPSNNSINKYGNDFNLSDYKIINDELNKNINCKKYLTNSNIRLYHNSLNKYKFFYKLNYGFIVIILILSLISSIIFLIKYNIKRGKKILIYNKLLFIIKLIMGGIEYLIISNFISMLTKCYIMISFIYNNNLENKCIEINSTEFILNLLKNINNTIISFLLLNIFNFSLLIYLIKIIYSKLINLKLNQIINNN